MTHHNQMLASQRARGAPDACSSTCSRTHGAELEHTTESFRHITLHDTAQPLARATEALRDSLQYCSDRHVNVLNRQTAVVRTERATPARGNAGLLDPTVPMNGLYPSEVVAGRFRIVRFLNRGGMGEVYEAEDLAMRSQPRVALKIIRPEISANLRMISRFERETEIGKTITHSNVCRTYDLGFYRMSDASGNSVRVLFLTMELLLGCTLATQLNTQGSFTTSQALPLIRQIGAALNAVHDAGIVHCDLKPDNIMLVPVENQAFHRVVLTDFGLAKRFPGPTPKRDFVDLTYSGGTPDYMSPEQVRGISLEPSSDIYALGLLMYRMLTGTLPFPGTNADSRMRKRLQEHPASPVRYVPGLDPQWERVILKCLSVDPRQRFTSARDVISALSNADACVFCCPLLLAAVLEETLVFSKKKQDWVCA